MAAVCRIFVLALLELLADRLVPIEVFLLTLDVVVHDHTAVVAVNLTWREANRADSKVRTHVLSCSYFVGHQILIVHSIWIGSELHKEFCHVLGPAHSSKMQWCVAIIICDIRLRSMFKQQLEDFIPRIMSGSLK